MSFKRISAVVLCLIILATAVACNKESTDEAPTQKTTVTTSTTANTSTHEADSTDGLVSQQSQTHTVSDSTLTSEDVSPNAATTSVSDSGATDESVQSTAVVAPQTSSAAHMIEMYKKAAAKSNGTAKSEQVITLVDISINNGKYESALKIVKPIMSKLLANNSTETDGITGGYQNLVESDVAQIKSYKVGNNTAIEMTLREQTDGAQSDSKSGPVGHAISTVGDIGVVTAQLNDLGLPIEISAENTTIRYTNPTVKVIIGRDGKIICGTWNYTVEILLNDYKVGGSNVETTSVVLNNTITVNGGFKK